jgi:glycosyltransferase involved in cell wall biosynthesis
MTFPVSVVIPTIDSRYDFLVGRCLPSVRLAHPAEIIVVSGEDRNGNEKRNAGARAASQPYLLFVDDDSTVSDRILEMLVAAIEGAISCDVAYCGFKYIVEWENCRYLPKGEIFPGKWSYDRLRQGNFVDTTSLIRRAAFPGFDPEIKRFQDWDLWLTMAGRGARGAYVSQCLVEKFIIDDGISVKVPEEEARQAIIRKHLL